MGPRPLSILNLTVELILLAILLLFWMISMPIVVNGNAYYTANREIPLAMAGECLSLLCVCVFVCLFVYHISLV